MTTSKMQGSVVQEPPFRVLVEQIFPLRSVGADGGAFRHAVHFDHQLFYLNPNLHTDLFLHREVCERTPLIGVPPVTINDSHSVVLRMNIHCRHSAPEIFGVGYFVSLRKHKHHSRLADRPFGLRVNPLVRVRVHSQVETDSEGVRQLRHMLRVTPGLQPSVASDFHFVAADIRVSLAFRVPLLVTRDCKDGVVVPKLTLIREIDTVHGLTRCFFGLHGESDGDADADGESEGESERGNGTDDARVRVWW